MKTKKIVPKYAIGNVVNVVQPTQVLNTKHNKEEMKFDIEEVFLIGDEGLIICDIEPVENRFDILYQVILLDGEEQKIFSLSEEQITLFEDE